MFSAIQTQFNVCFNKFIDGLVNTSFSEYIKYKHIPGSYFRGVEEKLAEEVLGGVVAYDYKAVLFNTFTCLAIAETVLAVVTLATGYFVTAAVLGVFAAGSIVLRELINQNIHATLTGYLENLKDHPLLFRKLILKL